MTVDEITTIVQAVSYKPGWSIVLRADGDRLYVQVHVSLGAGVCARTRQPMAWKGGKHFLSQHMCRQEIVGACFGAFKAAEEHELREWFKYRSVAIYDPHLDPDRLVEFAADDANRNVRAGA